MKRTMVFNWTLNGVKMPAEIKEVGELTTKLEALQWFVNEKKEKYNHHFSSPTKLHAEVGDLTFGLFFFDGNLVTR